MKSYPDPIHGQLRFDNSSEVERLIKCREFQRLHYIRQNGLAYRVFHGAEHSRFPHSMGVAYLAQKMYNCVLRNMAEPTDREAKLATTLAALLHDIGHGPFSHTIEESLKAVGINFKHETLTVRIIEESDTQINAVLREIDPSFPSKIVPFIDQARRKSDNWIYQVVSSQLDADRLDYLLRDSTLVGLQEHGFALNCLLEKLYHLDGKRIAVHKSAIGPLEAYLLRLDQMYRDVYYHAEVRAATIMLNSVLKRAIVLYKNGESNIFPKVAGKQHPLRSLIEQGENVLIDEYISLTDDRVRMLIEEWQESNDPTLADLSRRFIRGEIFKTVDVDTFNISNNPQLSQDVANLVVRKLHHVTKDLVEYYVINDNPSRMTYKIYDNYQEENDPLCPNEPLSDKAIWIIDDNARPRRIEDEPSCRIVSSFKEKRYFSRLVFPPEVYQEVKKALPVGTIL